MHVAAIGVDSETRRGKPITFQFYSKELGIEKIIWLDPRKEGKDASRLFFSFLDSLPATRDRHYVLFGHNLSFDFVSFFYDRHHRLREESIREEWHGWKVEIVYAAVRFATFSKRQKNITVIDTGAFFVTSLEKLAKIFTPSLLKLDAPRGLGQRLFTRADKRFCKYAMRDSEIAYYVGLFLLERHREFDVTLAVSGPHFASKVFRKHFLKEIIPLPPRKIVYASMAAYHGGKNNITVPPGMYRNIHSIDIKSAYPFAMASFPSFSNPKLYRAISGTGTPKALPAFGIYKISGTAKACKWPSLFSHNFKPLSGEVRGVWVTGFELNEALRTKEITLTSTSGYFYDAARDKAPSPFALYVREFYRRKETAAEKPQREFNKLLMNALYGKFIQTRGISGLADITFDLDSNALLEQAAIQAGGLFNPFIAALITGHTRAYIHRLEHQFHALHTSTDGIQAPKRCVNKRALRAYGMEGTLGSLSIEASGDALILRNKLYVLYGGKATRKERAEGAKVSRLYPGRKILKYALHGFHADVFTLEQLWKSGTREYEYIKVNKLRESLRRNLQVNDFVSRSGSVTLPGEERQSAGSKSKPSKGKSNGRTGPQEIQRRPQARKGPRSFRRDDRKLAQSHHGEKEKGRIPATRRKGVSG